MHVMGTPAATGSSLRQPSKKVLKKESFFLSFPFLFFLASGKETPFFFF